MTRMTVTIAPVRRGSRDGTLSQWQLRREQFVTFLVICIPFPCLIFYPLCFVESIHTHMQLAKCTRYNVHVYNMCDGERQRVSIFLKYMLDSRSTTPSEIATIGDSIDSNGKANANICGGSSHSTNTPQHILFLLYANWLRNFYYFLLACLVCTHSASCYRHSFHTYPWGS